MLEILSICLCLFFQDALILNKIAILGQPPWVILLLVQCFLVFELLSIHCEADEFQVFLSKVALALIGAIYLAHMADGHAIFEENCLVSPSPLGFIKGKVSIGYYCLGSFTFVRS